MALGCPVGRLAADRDSQAGPMFKAATAWMIIDGIRHLIVLRADVASPEYTLRRWPPQCSLPWIPTSWPRFHQPAG
jgi:hypothetical protein